VSGSLNCVTGAQDPNLTCAYDAATRTIRARWTNFLHGGGDGVLRFSASVVTVPASGTITNTANLTWTSLPGVPAGYDAANPGVQSRYNPLSTERYYDPNSPSGVDLYGTSSTVQVGLITETLPETGFAPGIVTDISAVPQTSFTQVGEIVLEIPALGLKLPVVGVPLKNGTWDLTWLGNQAGWLEGTAFPSWEGNSLVTAHIYGANGKPGPFFGLNKLRWGNRILIHAYGQTYTYEVRSVRTLQPNDMTVLNHEERAWLTLLTCKEFDAKTNTYKQRVAVRAVLVSVK
jgi:LPXTG-site transpeptidase (sortase) family protein